MAGIYIHIPFCKRACHYCDFHFSTQTAGKSEFVTCLVKEIQLQKDYLKGEKVNTIYFGGGTPSLLDTKELGEILESIFAVHNVSVNAEITLEANPDDLTKGKIESFKSLPINRFSVGVQSFFDADLKWMNRAHNAMQAVACIKTLQDSGYSNISLDLIYGLPAGGDNYWQENLSQAIDLTIQHLSCYTLTVEEGTPLASFIKKGKSKNVNEDQVIREFDQLFQKIKSSNWIQYEISNFALNEQYISRHNSSYWRGEKYLGIGPSAHSYDGQSRQWNKSNNAIYLKSLMQNIIPFEKEMLSDVQVINETIMTSLRTMWGVDLLKVRNKFGNTFSETLVQKANQFERSGLLVHDNNRLILTGAGKLIADKIILELIFDEEISIARDFRI
jgi:oxygen-independent coproporphyrinogen-3 oxidase